MTKQEIREYLERQYNRETAAVKEAVEEVRRRLDLWNIIPDGIAPNTLAAELRSAIERVDLHRAEALRISAQVEILDALEREDGE